MTNPLQPQGLKHYVASQLTAYWQDGESALALPIPNLPWPKEEPLPPRMKFVALPAWAEDLGIDGNLLVPAQFIDSGASEDWAKTDWFSVIFWYLNGVAEHAFEDKYGPIHSYSYRLKGWDPRIWERAWVNRMALFLRRWAARANNQSEAVVFGPLLAANILLTHDLDAIEKTFAIRLKQSVFHAYNAMRLLLSGQIRAAAAKALHALRFFFIREISIVWVVCALWKNSMACAA